MADVQIPTPDNLRRLKEMDRWQRNLRVGDGLSIQNDPGAGAVISLVGKTTGTRTDNARRFAWGKIVTAGPDGEADYTDHRYWVQRGYLTGATATDPLEVTVYPDTAGLYEIVTATNLAEEREESHFLREGQPVKYEWLQDKNGVRRCWIQQSLPSGTFLVKVVKDGGSAGDATTAATWTYTVKDVEGDTLGEDLTLQGGRAAGLIAYAPDNSYGLAAYDGTTLVLLEVYRELPDTGECETA